jgi:hypothetical protein
VNVKPFTLTLDKFNSFPKNNMYVCTFLKIASISHCRLFVEPTINPPDGLQILVNALLKVFPQCDDLVKKSGDGLYKVRLDYNAFLVDFRSRI